MTMNIRVLLASSLILGVMAAASSAFAQSDCTKLVPVSPFGKDDQTGATNRITPAVTKAAAAEIKEGKVTSLTNNLVDGDRKSTRLNSSHTVISYAVFCLKKKKNKN